MGTVISLLIGIALIGFSFLGAHLFSQFRWAARIGSFVVGLFVIVAASWNSSIIVVPDDQTGHYTRTYLGSSMRDGQIIATGNQQGPNARIWGPGLHVEPLMGLWGNFEMLPVIEIPADHYGVVVAVDGYPLGEDAIAARPLPGTAISASIPVRGNEPSPPPVGTIRNVFDSQSFLTSSEDGGLGGQKGLQSSVLLPGTHRINLYLFSIRVTDARGNLVGYYDSDGYADTSDNIRGLDNTPTVATEVPTGFVGVVRSNIDEGWRNDCDDVREVEQGDLTATLVPVGCKGVWERPLTPGSYFLNPMIYDVTMIDTRAQRFEYSGGYSRCVIPLDVTPTGGIEQGERRCQDVPVSPSAADRAINVISEGWDIPVELRVMGQVTAEQAPAIVAAVGDLSDVEDRIITPMIRSRVRNIGGGRIFAPIDDICSIVDGSEVCESVVFEEDTPHPFMTDHNGNPVILSAGTQAYAYRATRALDFSNQRAALEAEISQAVMSGSTTSGINLLEVTMGEPAVPPELLIAPQRDQIASQLEVTFVQEERAQQARIATEQQRATANQQAELVAAQIYAQTQQQRGNADREYLEALTAGQRAQASVLGEDRVQELRELELRLDFQLAVAQMLVDNPEIVGNIDLPNTVLFGGGGLENSAAILQEALMGSSTPR